MATKKIKKYQDGGKTGAQLKKEGAAMKAKGQGMKLKGQGQAMKAEGQKMKAEGKKQKELGTSIKNYPYHAMVDKAVLGEYQVRKSLAPGGFKTGGVVNPNAKVSVAKTSKGRPAKSAEPKSAAKKATGRVGGISKAPKVANPKK